MMSVIPGSTRDETLPVLLPGEACPGDSASSRVRIDLNPSSVAATRVVGDGRQDDILSDAIELLRDEDETEKEEVVCLAPAPLNGTSMTVSPAARFFLDVPLVPDSYHFQGYAADDEEVELEGQCLVDQVDMSSKIDDDDPTRHALEVLQLQTIFSLVERVRVNTDGTEMTKTLLFLTNRQALNLPLVDITKLMSALDILPRPKLVINVVQSHAFDPTVVLYGAPCSEHHYCGSSIKLFSNDVNCCHYFVSEESLESAFRTEVKISVFLQSCLFPLAREHNALVILGDNRCVLANTIGRMCVEEAKRNGGVLPFTVMCFAAAIDMMLESKNVNSLVGQLKDESTRWSERFAGIAAANQHSRGNCRMNWVPCGVPQGCSHYVVCDGVSNGCLDVHAVQSLRTSFVQSFANECGSIAIATASPRSHLSYWGPMCAVEMGADCVTRGIPLLLLDSRDPPTKLPNKIDEIFRHLEELESRLNSANTRDFYYASMWSFLHSAMARILRKGAKAANSQIRVTTEKNGARPDDEELGHGFIWSMITAHKLREEQSRTDLHSEDEGEFGLDRETLSKNKVANDIINRAFRMNATSLNFDGKLLVQRCKSYAAAIKRCESTHDLNSLLENMCHCPYFLREPSLVKRLRASPMFSVREGLRQGKLWVYIAQAGDGVNVNDAKQSVLACVEDTLRLGPSETFGAKFQLDSDAYQRALVMMTSTLTYSANLSDVQRIQKIFRQVHSVNSDTDENSLVALELLRRAWDDFDVYTAIANQMKKIGKVSFKCLLLLGFLVGAVTIVSLNEPEGLSGDTVNACVFTLSFISSLVAALIAIYNPIAKWHHLRSAASAIESEIWKFRSRTGSYHSTNQGGCQIAEEHFQTFLATTEESVMKSRSLSKSDFLARFELFGKPSKPDVYKHGQYQDPPASGSRADTLDDDYQHPVMSQEYLALRVEPHLRFYQSRIPVYARVRNMAEVFLVLGALSGSLLAFLKLSGWAGISAALTAAVTSYTQFSNTESKLERYSDAVQQGNLILLWWRSLTTIEQSTLSMRTSLVTRCEDLFLSERSKWMTSAVSQKMLVEEATSRKERKDN